MSDPFAYRNRNINMVRIGHPVKDPTGDLRAAFLARLEYDISFNADRTDFSFKEQPEDDPDLVNA